MKTYHSKLKLYNQKGQRKYLNQQERKRFYDASFQLENGRSLYTKMLFWTGARPSEILNLKVHHIDMQEKLVIIESLKKRQKGIYRRIPLPDKFLHLIHEFVLDKNDDEFIWKFSRRTACRIVHQMMADAEITGPQATARGLRHSFAIQCISKNLPLSLVKKWLGHARISTTEIYLDIVGLEERQFAERIWEI